MRRLTIAAAALACTAATQPMPAGAGDGGTVARLVLLDAELRFDPPLAPETRPYTAELEQAAVISVGPFRTAAFTLSLSCEPAGTGSVRFEGGGSWLYGAGAGTGAQGAGAGALTAPELVATGEAVHSDEYGTGRYPQATVRASWSANYVYSTTSVVVASELRDVLVDRDGPDGPATAVACGPARLTGMLGFVTDRAPGTRGGITRAQLAGPLLSDD